MKTSSKGITKRKVTTKKTATSKKVSTAAKRTRVRASASRSRRSSVWSNPFSNRLVRLGFMAALAVLAVSTIFYAFSWSATERAAKIELENFPEVCDDPTVPDTESLSEVCKQELALAPTGDGCTPEALATASCLPGDTGGETLGESTAVFPLTWPILASEWPQADPVKYPNNPNKKLPPTSSTPIYNCDLLYGTGTARRVSTGFQIMISGVTSVYAAADGIVSHVAPGTGVLVLKVTQSNGKVIYVSYQNLKERYVEMGAVVKKGQKVGLVWPANPAAYDPLADPLHFGVWNTVPINNGFYLGVTKPNFTTEVDVATRLLARMEHPMNYLPLDGRNVAACKTARPAAGYVKPSTSNTVNEGGGGTAGGTTTPTPAPVCTVKPGGNMLYGPTNVTPPTSTNRAIQASYVSDVNAVKMYNYLISKGFKGHQAAGILANLYWESWILPNRKQGAGIQYTTYPVNRVGFGIAQWTYTDRQRPLVLLAREMGLPVYTLTPQAAWLWRELRTTEVRAYNAIKATTTYTAATREFMIKFERPRDQGSSYVLQRVKMGQTRGYTNLIGSSTMGTNGCLVVLKDQAKAVGLR